VTTGASALDTATMELDRDTAGALGGGVGGAVGGGLASQTTAGTPEVGIAAALGAVAAYAGHYLAERFA